MVKFDRNGRFVKEAGTRGSQRGQLNLPHTMAMDAAGNVYVGDRSNVRVQVFDNDLNVKAIYDNVGNPWAVCISPGPHQYLFVSNSLPDNGLAQYKDITGEIYKMELDGTIIGKFGKAGKKLGEFSTVHEIDCRNPNELLVSEITAWRVQKILLSRSRDAAGPSRQVTGEPTMNASRASVVASAALLLAVAPSGQTPPPEIAYESAANLLKMPADIHLGEVAGRRDRLEGADLRLHADGQSHRRPGQLAAVHARRLAALPVRSARQLRAGDRPGRLCASWSRTACAWTRRTTSGSWTRARARSSSSARTGACC